MIRSHFGPNQTPFLLQTYYIDHIGRSDIRYQPGYSVSTLNDLGFNENEIFKSNKHKIKFSVPYWFHFIGNHFHYLPLTRTIFNYSEIVQFDPPYFQKNFIPYLTLVSGNVTVMNKQSKKITILDAFTSSTNIIIERIEPTSLEPGDSLTIYFYLIHVDHPPQFSNLILISSNMGTFPYYVTCTMDITTRPDIPIQTIFHQSTVVNSNISIRIPSSIDLSSSSMIYDALIFDTNLLLRNTQHNSFHTIGLKNGVYFSFIYIITNPTTVYTYPLIMLTTSKLLQPYNPIILVEPITSPSETHEAEIQLVNPTFYQFTIQSITLDRDAPSNIKVELLNSPVTCRQYSYKTIGRVIVRGNKQGKIDTSISVHFEAPLSESARISQVITIPVRASVLYGSLEPNETQLNIEQTSYKSKFIHFTNHFQVPVAIISVKTSSNMFVVTNFIPEIIEPGQQSKDYKIEYFFKHVSIPLETILIIETNATNLQLPIKGYNGYFTISKTPDNTTNAFTFKNIGDTFQGATINSVFYVQNPNPVEYTMNEYVATPGIVANGYWQDNLHEPLRDHVLAPYSTEKINVFISFSENLPPFVRNDTFSIGSSGSFVHVVLQWKPVIGNNFIAFHLPQYLVLGRSYTTEIEINSTFPIAQKLGHIRTNIPNSNMEIVESHILPNQCTKIGNLSFLFDSQLFGSSQESILFDNNLSYTENKELWSKYWPSKLSRSFKITLHLENGQYFTFDYHTLFKRPRFPHLKYNFGCIVPYTGYNGSVVINNFLDSPVAFRFHKNHSIRSDIDQFVIPGNSQATFDFSYVGTTPGLMKLRIPVTTNASKPFLIGVQAEVVAMNVSFVDYFGETIDSVRFTADDEISHAVLTKYLYLINRGKTDVNIGHIFVRSRLFVATRLCPSILKQNETCKVEISVLLKYLRNQTEESSLFFYVHGTQISCKLQIFLNKNAMNYIQRQRIIREVAIILFSLVLPVKELVTLIIKSKKQKDELDRRFTYLPDEIERLSVSMKTSIATQNVIQHEEVSCGKWTLATSVDSQRFLTSEALECLEEILNSLV